MYSSKAALRQVSLTHAGPLLLHHRTRIGSNLEPFIFVLFLCALIIVIYAYWYNAPICPKCGTARSKRFEHQTKSGQADRRFSNNPYICTFCGHEGPAVSRADYKSLQENRQFTRIRKPESRATWNRPSASRQFNLPTSTINLHGRVISGALIYTIDAEHDQPPYNPSTIITQLAIGNASDARELSYWPSYYFLSPDQRAAYLDWLAGGRQSSTADVGYAFLYFYGLEWRSLIDKKNKTEVVNALLSLYRIYGYSKSFHEYTTNLLGAILHGSHVNSMAPVFNALSTHAAKHGGLSPLFLDAILFQYAGKKIPFEYCLEIAKAAGSFKKGVAFERQPEAFISQFETIFRTQYPEGMPLPDNTPSVSAPYRWAMRGSPESYSISTTGLLLGSSGKKKDLALQPLWSDLHAAWDAAAKVIGTRVRRGSSETMRNVVDTTKPDLVTISSKRALDDTTSMGQPLPAMAPELEWYNSHCDDLGVVRASLGEINNAFGRGKPTIINPSDHKRLLEALDSAGFAMEPDMRPRLLDAIPTDPRRIFRIDHPGKPSARCQKLKYLLNAVLAVASQKGALDDHEIEEIVHHIDSKNSLSPSDITRLRQYGSWLIEENKLDHSFDSLTAMKLPKQSAQAVATLALNTLIRDHHITPDDERELRRLYNALNVPTEQLETILHAASTGPGAIEIDWHAVARLQAETQDVQMMLADSLVHEEAESNTLPIATLAPASSGKVQGMAAPITSIPSSNPASFGSLDPRAQAVVLSLHGKNILSALDFKAICASHGLMPSAAIDLINEWSDVALGDRLIDGDGPYQIAAHLITEKMI